MNTLRNVFLLLLPVFLFVGCIEDEKTGSGSCLMPGDELPDFSVISVDGKTLTKSDLEEKVSLLVFFNTVCPDCREELPVIQIIYDKYSGNEEFYLACVSVSEDMADIKSYWEINGLDIPCIVPENDTFAKSLGFSTIPHVFLFDRSVTVRYVYGDDPVASFESLSDAIDALL